MFQSEVTKQRGGDRLALLNHRFRERCSAAQCGGDDVGHPAQITQRGGDQLRAFLRVRGVRRQFFTHGFVAGLHLSSLRDLRLGVGELLQRAQLGDELLGGRVGHCSPDVDVFGFGFLGFSQEGAPFEGWLIVLRFRWKQRFASHVWSSGRHEHRSLVQLAAVLPALSRCAIPHETVTTERVANSHSIIRSLRRVWCRCGDVGLGQLGGAPPVVWFVFGESRAELPGGRPDARRRSGPPPRLIKRRRAGGCRPWPDRGSPCSRCSAARRRTMPDQPGSSPHARQWY